MADQFDVNRRLAPQHAATKSRLEGKMLNTTMRLRFGNTADLSKNSANAQALAHWADEAQETYRGIFDTHWKVMATPTLTEAGRLVRSAKHANKTLTAMQSLYEQRMGHARSARDSLSERIDGALRPPSNAGDLAQDAEVRAILRAETNDIKRMALAKKFPRAVATMPAELSGMGSEQYTALSRQYIEATLPEVFAEFAETSAAIEAAETAHKALTAGVAEFIDFPTAKLYADQSHDPDVQDAA